jgi:hypothetical protein
LKDWRQQLADGVAEKTAGARRHAVEDGVPARRRLRRAQCHGYTAVRHKLPVLVVISLNSGCTADPKREKPRRELGYTRDDKTAEALGYCGKYVDKAESIRPTCARPARGGRARVAGASPIVDAHVDDSSLQFAQYAT